MSSVTRNKSYVAQDNIDLRQIELILLDISVTSRYIRKPSLFTKASTQISTRIPLSLTTRSSVTQTWKATSGQGGSQTSMSVGSPTMSALVSRTLAPQFGIESWFAVWERVAAEPVVRQSFVFCSSFKYRKLFCSVLIVPLKYCVTKLNILHNHKHFFLLQSFKI